MASYERKLEKAKGVKYKIVSIKHPFVSRNHCKDCQRWYFREHKRQARNIDVAAIVNGAWA